MTPEEEHRHPPDEQVSDIEKPLWDAACALQDYQGDAGTVTNPDTLLACAARLLQLAADAIANAEEAVRAAKEGPAVDLVALLELGVPSVNSNLGSLRTALEGIAHDRLTVEGDVVLPDGRRVYATRKKESVKTDGARIIGVLAARAADEWDGEPPHAFAERVIRKADACAGMTNASFKWRKTALAKEGVDLEAFSSSERGAKTVGITAPAAVRIGDSEGGAAA